MGRFLRKGVLFTLLFAGVVAPASADPLLMFLIGIARQMVEAHAERSMSGAAPAPEVLHELPTVYPGTSVEPADLKRLIDDSFVYLSDAQRREIFNSLHAALMDPKNAAVRASMIEYFADRAMTVRAAQARLSKMSWSEKQRMAGEFKSELALLSPDDQAELGKLLRSGLLPVPNDLNQLLLATFDAR